MMKFFNIIGKYMNNEIYEKIEELADIALFYYKNALKKYTNKEEQKKYYNEQIKNHNEYTILSTIYNWEFVCDIMNLVDNITESKTKDSNSKENTDKTYKIIDNNINKILFTGTYIDCMEKFSNLTNTNNVHIYEQKDNSNNILIL